ncbi:MAG: hypothetical protein GC149_19610 [Gammaproteobacteria bacterium]|nr:hypothetical protein [Gammaproteobacteria bacterium]
MGSRLGNNQTGEEVWPGSVINAIFSSYDELAFAIDPVTLEPVPNHIVPTQITDGFAGDNYYGEIIRTLEVAGGYQQTIPGIRITDDKPRYYVFTYDWRQDNVKTVRELDHFIEQIRVDHANPELKVDVIAHSMGGLIARYYLRYGSIDVLDSNDFPVNLHGASRLRRVILLGTPNLGSVEAIRNFIAGRKVVFGHIKTEVLATMPSIYQLFPHAINDWLITTQGKPLDRDQFDVEIWRRFQWAVFDPAVQQRIAEHVDSVREANVHLDVLHRYFEKQLERARRFSWSLSVPLEKPHPLIVFGGDCHLTPARIVVEEVDGESGVRLWPNEIQHPVKGVDYDSLMLEPGDGVVTKASLLARQSLDLATPRHKYSFFPLYYSFFLCERHDQLTGNISFQDNLLHALLNRDPPLSHSAEQ